MKLIEYLIKEKMVPPFSTLPLSSGITETIINHFFGDNLVLYQIFSLIFLRTLHPLSLKLISNKIKNVKFDDGQFQKWFLTFDRVARDLKKIISKVIYL